MDPTQRNLATMHPDLQAFQGSLFGVRNEAMEAHIGCVVELHNPKQGGYYRFGTSGFKPHRIIGVQRIHDGSIAYRAVCLDKNCVDTFGRPVKPSDVAAWLPSTTVPQ